MAAVLAGLLTLAPAALAGPAAQHPDLSGYWDPRRGGPVQDPALAAKFAPGTVVIRYAGVADLPVGDYGGLDPKPAALAAAKVWKPIDDMTISKACQPPSIIFAMQGPFPIQIDQGTDFVILRLEYYDMVRIIFMNRDHHLPAEAPHTKTGDSIGHWDGDTLVVDTDHLEASTFTNNGLNHSDKVHVIERFRLSDDGKTLLSTQEFDDPETLNNRGARFITWTKNPGHYIYPYECDPSYVLNYHH